LHSVTPNDFLTGLSDVETFAGGFHRRPTEDSSRWTSASRRRGHRRIDAGDIDAGETSAHRIEGEADPLLVVTEECLARRGGGPARAIVTPDAPPAIAARGSACP